jgi:fructose-bisphosphate aldolase/6-deoxy-5-ketofructose 1-phosphate synthase
MMVKTPIIIPADVPKNAVNTYSDNYAAITHGTGRLMLFACDQKMEHLNNDFHGPNIHPDAQNPEHIFRIAQQGRIGALATHLGLIARYGKNYTSVNYIVKLNGKTDLIKSEIQDPYSKSLWDVEDVIEFQKTSGLNIRGVGYTIYLGSSFEHKMLADAAEIVRKAHEHGLIALLWIYARGKSITDDQDPKLLAGAAGVAASLGSDFVKIKAPKNVDDLRIITAAAGNTNVICAGGQTTPPEQFFQILYDQLHTGGTAGNATGRNIFQKSLPQAVAMTNGIAALIFDNADVKTALTMYSKTL